MQTASFRTPPFTSPSCVQDLETALPRQVGITSAAVELEDRRVDVEFDSMKTNVEKIADLITGLGYPVLSTKLY